MPRNSNKKSLWDKELSSIMDLILEGSIKIKQAAEVGRRAVEYFRGVDFCKYMLKNREMLIKKHSSALEGNLLETVTDAEEFGNRLIRNGFIYRAQYKPFEQMKQQKEKGEIKKPKWPKRLSICSKQFFEEDGFYIIIYEGNKSWHYFMLTVIICGVLLLCMFPVWPLAVKVSVWYFSVIMLTLILVLVFGRLILFVIFWFFGVDFWFLPNLFNEDAGVVDSFIPCVQFIYRNDNWLNFFARIFSAVLFCLSIYKLGETHSVSDVSHFAKQSFLDVLDWGHQKLAAIPESKPKYPSINDIESSLPDEHENEGDHEKAKQPGLDLESDESDIKPVEDASSTETEENYSCLKDCGYTTFEQLMDSCLMDCQCAAKLLTSRCFPNCPEETKKVLIEAKLDTCYYEEERKKKKKVKHEL